MLAEKNICTGCGVCAVVCPHNCIEMVPDHEGFRQPVIDRSKCVYCRLCERSCAVLQKPEVHELPTAFAAKNRNANIREESSSGGVFTALAEAVLNQGGVVCAARYNVDFSVIHGFARNVQELAHFRGAKYAQSKAEHCYSEIKQMLIGGTVVLFVGTPCQVAGLSSYLGKPYDKLILVDMVCHGVPSPLVWEKYICARQRTDSHDQLGKVNLRSKKSGWSRYGYSVEINYLDGSVYSVPQGQDWFMRGFVENLYLRKSCENCNFKGIQRCSDITIGDFWGIWDIHPEFDDNKGTSLLWVHTKTGNALWQEVYRQFVVLQCSAEESVRMNPSALNSSKPHRKRNEFFALLDNKEVIPHIQEALTEPDRKENLFSRILNRFKK